MKREPIAIVGMGCRFPGEMNKPSKVWEKLCQGIDAISDVPLDRWDNRLFFHKDKKKSDKVYTKQGGFLSEDIYQSDPVFFSISPKEARSLDPQQFLLLEVAWEAMEDAGVIPKSMEGSNTGVFIGSFNVDCLIAKLQLSNHYLIDHHSATGVTATILSARLAYTFDLRGPCISLDTACSSSLVALHYACQSIWNQECEMALAGGVNIMLAPFFVVPMCKSNYLSEDNRCRSFDAQGTGYVRGEGAGVIFLKPLSMAIQDKNPIYAVINGTGVNQDGRTLALPVPSQEAQAALIQKTLKQAGIKGNQLQYIEAHGTGTAVGDPIEAEGIYKGLKDERNPASDPCIIGSIKSNIGHLESAAGIAGVIKAALCLKHRQIPPSIHFNIPNPKIPFEHYGFEVPTKIMEFPRPNDPLYVGVNSFGFGGTNAHVIMSEVPKTMVFRNKDPVILETSLPFTLTAKTPEALRDLANKYYQFLKDHEVDLQDLSYTVLERRSHLEYRLFFTAKSLVEVKGRLKSYINQEKGDFIIGRAPAKKTSKIVFVYSGHVLKWQAMGQELYKKEPVFKKMIDQCAAFLDTISNWSFSVAFHEPKNDHHRLVVQTAVQIGLTALLQEWDIKPSAVLGYGFGEIAACYAAGALTIEDALLVSYHRSRLLVNKQGKQKMLNVAISESEAQEFVNNFIDDITIAAVNSQYSVTLSGNSDILEKLSVELEKNGILTEFFEIEVADHNDQLKNIAEELKDCLKNIHPNVPQIPVYSTATTRNESSFDPSYWSSHLTKPVLFFPTLNRVLSEKFSTFVEIGHTAFLESSISTCLASKKMEGACIKTMSCNFAETDSLFRCLGELYIHGVPVQWNRLFSEECSLIPLPTYPWQRKKHWQESKEYRYWLSGLAGHPMLKSEVSSPDYCYETRINEYLFPWLLDHKLQNAVVMPGAAYVEIALAMHQKVFQKTSHLLRSVKFCNPMTHNSDLIELQINVSKEEKNLKIYSKKRKNNEFDWVLHATAQLEQTDFSNTLEPIDFNKVKEELPLVIAGTDLYPILERVGLNYGPEFRLIDQLHYSPKKVLGRLKVDKDKTEGYLASPQIIDNIFQALVGIHLVEGTSLKMALPIEIDRVDFIRLPEDEYWVYGELISLENQLMKGDLYLCDAKGNICMSIKEFTCKLFESIKKETSGEHQKKDYAQLRQQLLEMDLEERQDKISTLLISTFSSVLQNVSENINTNQSLKELGIDSLAGVEIQLLVEEMFDVNITSIILKKDTTIFDLVSYISEEMEQKSLNCMEV